MLSTRRALLSSGIRPFSPASIPGLALWLRSDAGTFTDTGLTTPATADNDAVKGWQDQSGLGNHVTEATNNPTLDLAVFASGAPGILFDGTNDRLIRTALAAAIVQPFTAFAVVRSTGVNAFPSVFDAQPTGSACSLYRNTVSTRLEFSAGAALATTGDLLTTPCVLEVVVNGASSLVLKDGTQIASGNVGANGLAGITLGNSRSPSASTPLNGHLGQFVLYSGALSAGQRALVRAYLGAWAGVVVA